MPSFSLFEELPAESHRLAFERWLADQRALGSLRQSSSIQVYRDMWGSFTAWCLGQSPAVSLASLDVRDLQAFQAARFGMKSADLSLSPRHALRLLRLIDRVLHHHAAETGQPANTAASDWIDAHPEIRYAEAAQADPLPEFLSVAEARHLITFLSDARPRPSLSGSRRDSHLAFTWQQLRKRVAVALQLGGGPAPGDVRVLTVDAPTSRGGRVRERPWKVAVPGNGNSPARETPIAPGRASCCSTGSRSAQRLEFWGTSFSVDTQRQALEQGIAIQGRQAGLGGSRAGFQRWRVVPIAAYLRIATAAARDGRRSGGTLAGVEPKAMGKYRRVVSSPEDVI